MFKREDLKNINNNIIVSLSSILFVDILLI